MTVIGFGCLVLGLICLSPFGIIAWILYLSGLRKQMRVIIYRIAQGWGRFVILVTNCKVTLSGREKIPKKGGMCFVSNHDGFFDIVLLLAYSGRPFGFIAKKELLYIPMLNLWIYMLGGLFIDRRNIKNAIKTIDKGVKRIKAGGGMIIFPEGHRSKGRGLLPFHPGSLKLATSAGAPIVPVAIEGSYGVFEKNKRVIRGVRVKLSFLDVIDTAKIPSTDRKQILCDQIFSAISGEMACGKLQAADSPSN